jgi:tRNA(fMet)-specific endonuclease VapC
MEKVILDTDVFIEIFNRNEELFDFINEHIALENIVTTAITEAELILGATNKETQAKIEKYLKDVKIVGVTLNATNIFAGLIKQYHLSHHIQIADCLIASICLANNLPLLTFNTKHFKYIPNLRLIPHNIKPIKIASSGE